MYLYTAAKLAVFMGYNSINKEGEVCIWRHINFRRAQFYDHIEKCGVVNDCRDPWQERKLVQDEIEYDNLDLSFDWSGQSNHNVTIEHRCTWVDCDWKWKSTIQFSTNIIGVMYESPQDAV